MKISFLAFTCSKHMNSASGNQTLDILFYKTETEIRNAFQPFLTKSNSIAFSLLFSIHYVCYSGIQGFLSQIDDNGDAEGNYTLLARQAFKSSLSNYSMRPVGHFRLDTGNFRADSFYKGLPVSNHFSYMRDREKKLLQ